MATVTQSELDFAYIRRSAEDFKRIMDALKADGVLTVEADLPPEEGEPQVDPEGNPVLDADGNPLLQPVQNERPTDLTIAIDNMPDESEPQIPEDIVVEVAPGTQNAAAPFPDEMRGGKQRSSRRRSRSEEAAS